MPCCENSPIRAEIGWLAVLSSQADQECDETRTSTTSEAYGRSGPGPSQTLTLVFTDIEGSTRLVQALRGTYPAVLDTHHAMIRTAVVSHGGRIEETTGDGVFASFPDPTGALTAVVDVQRRLASHPWPEGADVRVRIGVHTGVITKTETGYTGVDLHRAARISAAAWGGQILVSATTHALTVQALPDGIGLRDLGEHRLKDLETPARLFEVVADGLRTDLPPPRTLDAASRTNLPTQLTSFIGRDDDVQQIVELLDDHRLVTLTGVGGVGKTRLAMEVATKRLDRHPDGVWLVELAPLTEPDLVVRTLATALGVREQPDQDLLQTVIGVLKTRTCLIVLDNCEHLIDASAALTSTLLSRCASVRVLATSREGLAVNGETIRALRSLDVPGDDAALTPSEIETHEAVALLLERARSVDSSFSPSAEELATIAKICRRLDGIPLAIELAAARLRSLDVKHVAERLDDRFRLLAGGSRTALPRQRTLEATLGWSYELLDEEERTLFRRLAVFSSGFTVESCEVVCSDTRLPTTRVVDLVESLVDKSLVVVDRSQGSYRYRMLETVRDYARRHLEDSGEAATVRSYHSAWIRTLAAQAEPHLRGPDQRRWLDLLAVEHAEIRAALDWAIASGEVRDAARIATALTYYFAKRSHSVEHLKWLSRIWKATAGADPELSVLIAIGTASFPLGSDQLDPDYSFERTLDLAREVGTDSDTARALLNLAYHLRGSDAEREESSLQEALALARRLDDPGLLVDVLYTLATRARLSGDADRAREFIEDALDVARSCGELWDVGWSLGVLGQIAGNTGDLDLSEARIKEASDAFGAIGDEYGLMWTQTILGVIALLRGATAVAVDLWEPAYAGYRRRGYMQNASDVAVFLARADRLLGRPDAARAWLVEALGLRVERSRVLIVEEAAALISSGGQPQHAVMLLAAADAARVERNEPQLPYWAEHLSDIVAALRDDLGEADFEAAWAGGKRLDIDEALTAVSTWLGELTEPPVSRVGTPSARAASPASPRAP